MMFNWEMRNNRGQSEGLNAALISEENLHVSCQLIGSAGQKRDSSSS